MRPLRHGEGVTVNGHRILWELRCCNSSKAVGMTEWDVGIGAPGRNVLLKLLMVRMADEDEKAAVASFQGMVRSLRPVATDRAFALDPAPGPPRGSYTRLDMFPDHECARRRGHDASSAHPDVRPHRDVQPAPVPRRDPGHCLHPKS